MLYNNIVFYRLYLIILKVLWDINISIDIKGHILEVGYKLFNYTCLDALKIVSLFLNQLSTQNFVRARGLHLFVVSCLSKMGKT